jgi:hypothetical protein
MIDVNGALVNGLPDTPAQGVAAGGAKFGQICFLADCTTLSGTQAAGDGTAVFLPGGPGSTDFVPNNIRANPAAGVRARYYDVTLSAPGTTTLGSSVTIDRMALDGQTRLNVGKGGSLNVLGTYTQAQGWTNVDGRVESGRDMLLVSGMLSGTGTVRAPFVTAVGAIVAPAGGDRIGTLTVDGNMILASASSLFIDASRAGADRLAVTGNLALGGGSLVFNKLTDAAAPRHGQKFDIATAASIDGRFGNVFSFQGVLRPEITYTNTAVTAELRAGSLVTILDGQNATALAFAGALDQLRSSSYNQLFALYGAVDLMGAQQLSATLGSLAPRITGETRSLQDSQSRVMLNAVTDRLSSLGTASAPAGLSIVGSPAMFGDAQRGQVMQASAANLIPTGAAATPPMPRGMSGFISGGATMNRASYGTGQANVQAQRSSHVGMGLEMELADGLTVGTAFGIASGFSAPGVDRTEAKTTQVAAYGSYRLGGGAYVGGVASAETSRANFQRNAQTGDAVFDLHGATTSSRYNLMAEAGVNLPVAPGITLTPRAQLGYGRYELGGFRENGGEVALQLDDLKLERVEARMGARLAGSHGLGGGWTLTPQLQGDYVRLLAGSSDGMKVRFANAGDHVFALPLAGGDTSWAEARGGLSVTNGRFAIGAGMETSIGRTDARDSRAVADMTFRF